MRTQIKPVRLRLAEVPDAAVMRVVELLAGVVMAGRESEEADRLLMELAEEITPGPARLAAIRASLPPSRIDYDDEGEMPY